MDKTLAIAIIALTVALLALAIALGAILGSRAIGLSLNRLRQAVTNVEKGEAIGSPVTTSDHAAVFDYESESGRGESAGHDESGEHERKA